MRKPAYIAHVALGAIGALFLALVCLTGTLATLAPELDRFAARDVPAAGDAVAWQAARDAAEARYGEGSVRALMVSRERLQSRVRTEGGERRLYHHPESGAVLRDERFRNARWLVRDFHRRLLAGRPGHYAVCASAVLLLLSLLSGLAFERRPLRRLFDRPKGARARSRSLHVKLGIFALPFVLVITATGLFYLVEGVAEDAGLLAFEPPPTRATSAPPRSLDAHVAAARARLPALRPSGLWFQEGSVVVEGATGAWLTRDRAQRVVLDRGGAVLEATLARDLPPLRRVIEAADPLHFGSFGGRPTRWLWALFGLALTGLCLTGVEVQLRRLAQQEPRRPLTPDLA